MTQSNPIIGADKSGLQYRNEDNDGKRALLNHHKGATAPSYAEAGALWLDDNATPWLLKWYDGTSWITQGSLDAGSGLFTPYVNGAALGDAGESSKGLVLRASDAEAAAGEDTQKFITPAQLAAYGGGDFLTSVSQGDVNTSTGEISGMVSTTGAIIGTLPGGEYGFSYTLLGVTGASFNTYVTTDSNSYAAKIFAHKTAGGGTSLITVKQRYITASPPFDMGDGTAYGFLYLKLDAAGNIIGHYLADVPPWGYNGPTSVRADKIDRITGKKYRKVLTPQTMEAYMDGAPLEYIYEEITQEIKNADMDLIPQPFALAEGETAVLVDPLDQRIEKLIELQNTGGDVAALISGGFVRPDNEALSRSGPAGIMQVAWKND
ncbi:MAG: hypothetical protein HND56_01210 [Pseudomonadota bacterium]|nr:hypothetical protein [Pseudomonadota bacterium]QKK04383.1 MAG: hypothetical protein HND56_01210 [Pseudomonadota bacterium]